MAQLQRPDEFSLLLPHCFLTLRAWAKKKKPRLGCDTMQDRRRRRAGWETNEGRVKVEMRRCSRQNRSSATQLCVKDTNTQTALTEKPP